MGGGKIPSVPNPDIYRVCAVDTPMLKQYEQRLAMRGLKDPWIRNEVWKFSYKQGYRHWSTNMVKHVFLGFPLAVALTTVTIIFRKQMGWDEAHH